MQTTVPCEGTQRAVPREQMDHRINNRTIYLLSDFVSFFIMQEVHMYPELNMCNIGTACSPSSIHQTETNIDIKFSIGSEQCCLKLNKLAH